MKKKQDKHNSKPQSKARFNTYQLHPEEELDQIEDDSQNQAAQEHTLKAETFVQCTEKQPTLWRLFKTLDCSECGKIYNNRQRKPFIICANNHLLCKSCYTKIRQSTYLCPFCNIRLSTKNNISHESIQMFLKIYNEIFQKQKNINEQKRKKSYLNFQIPKNIRTLTFLMLIIITPWLFDGLKFVVYWLIDLEYRVLSFLWDQISQFCYVIKIIIEDQFYINLFTNQNGDYVYYGDSTFDSVFNSAEGQFNATHTQQINSLYTPKHKVRIQSYLRFMFFFGYLIDKLVKVVELTLKLMGLLNYILHFAVIIIGTVQFPFLVPILLLRLQYVVPRKYCYRFSIYLEILESEQSTQCGYFPEPQEIQKLSKGQLYFCLIVRNYIQTVLKLYKRVEVDMKKRCQELQYKKKMRLIKKSQKETLNTKGGSKALNVFQKVRFTF